MRRSILTACALLAGCALPPKTLYQPLVMEGPEAGGYQEQRLADNRYEIAFLGNEYTPRPRVEKYLRYRAAELTLKAGYDGFAMIAHHIAIYDRAEPTSDWHPCDGCVGDPGTDYTSYTATAEIRMFHGRPNLPDSFDARRVAANLGPTVQTPH